MEETVEQKIIRNVQGNFAIYKTPEVVGDKTMIANIEWEDSEDIDKFFMFAKNLGAKVIYLSEGEEEDEQTNQTRTTILQVGFLHDGIMHHINFVEDDDEEEDEDEDEYEEDEDIDEQDEENQTAEQSPQNIVNPQQVPQNQTPESKPQSPGGNQFIGGGINQPQKNNFNQNNF